MPFRVGTATLRSMSNPPHPAEELRLLDHELSHLEARRAQLLARRTWLLGVLRSMQEAAAPSYGPSAGPQAAAWAPRAQEQGPRRAGADASGPGVQNALLVLGGILLTVAAVAFTLVSWGSMGIGGRSAVLGTVTLLALAAPVFLLRKGLRSTAEATGALGLMLTVLDAYALHRVALPDVDGVRYTAVASAVLAAVWAGYGMRLGGLRLPLPAGVLAAQLPLVLWAGSAGAGTELMTAALLATAAFDAALALGTGGRGVRLFASVAGCVAGGSGLLAAAWLSWSAHEPAPAARAGLLLLVAVAVALTVAWRTAPPGAEASGAMPAGGERSVAAAFVAGGCAVAAAGGMLRTVLPGDWPALGYLVCGAALSACAATRLAPPVRLGLIGASVAVQGLVVASALPVLLRTLAAPLAGVQEVWSGAPDALWGTPVGALGAPVSVLVFAGAAGTATVAARAGVRRVVFSAVALVTAWAALLVLPAALDATYPAGVATHVLLGVAALACAVRATSLEVTLTALALTTGTVVSVTLLSLAEQAATFAVLGVFGVLFLTVCAAPARVLTSGRARPEADAAGAPVAARLPADPVRVFVACASVLDVSALLVAVGFATELGTAQLGLLLLAVPAAVAPLAPRIADRTAGQAAEAVAALTGAAAVGLALTDPPVLATVLGLAGVIAAGTALRADRRPAAYVAAGLLVAASWVRLAAWDVAAPEAYTLPVTVAALGVGLLRQRREPLTSSWTVYGPGLAATLLPSLAAAWADTHWQRPLLLGTAALLVTLAGARYRRQAPLVLGGAVLILVALHELTPYIVQVMDALPRWVPPALAGLLLLALGATYEQRLRDARRVREALGRMR